jgi:hypothetical protein
MRKQRAREKDGGSSGDGSDVGGIDVGAIITGVGHGGSSGNIVELIRARLFGSLSQIMWSSAVGRSAVRIAIHTCSKVMPSFDLERAGGIPFVFSWERARALYI